MLRKSVRAFVEREVAPHVDEWEAAGQIPKAFWRRLGELGFLGLEFPVEYGGAGGDFLSSVVLGEEMARCRSGGVAFSVLVHTDMSSPWLTRFGNEAQKRRYLPGIVKGEIVCALGITEPGTGSDMANLTTRAVRSGDHYLLTGSKIFITNGVYGDLYFVAARTGPGTADRRHEGLSMFLVERGWPGFTVSRKLDKMGMRASDTAELAFQECPVPAENLLGVEGRGFQQLAAGLQRAPQPEADAAAQAGRDGDRDRGGAPSGLPRRIVLQRGRGLHHPGLHGQAVRDRGGQPRRVPGGPDARGLRLHAGVPRGALLPRRAALDHCVRDVRYHERDHRQAAAVTHESPLRAKELLMTQTRRRGLIASTMALMVAILAIMMTPALAQEVVKIGQIEAQTGPNAIYGWMSSQGTALAVDEINKAGGFKVGGKTYKIQLIALDTRGEPKEATVQLKRLIEVDGAKYIFGPFLSNVFLAVRPYAAELNGKILMWGGATRIHDYVGTPGHEFLMRTWNWDAGKNGFGELMVDNLVKSTGAKKIAMLFQNDQGGKVLEDIYVPMLKKKGIEYRLD